MRVHARFPASPLIPGTGVFRVAGSHWHNRTAGRSTDMVAEGWNLPHARAAVRTAAMACIVAGAFGVVAYLVEGFSPPTAGEQQYNYPLAPDTYVGVQLVYGFQHLALAFGLLGLIWGRTVPRSTLGTPSAYAASGSVALLAVAQFVAIAAAGETREEYFVELLDESFGFVTAAIGLTIVLTGIAVVWGRRWPAPWHYLPLVMGLYVFFPLIPALSAPMSAARIVLAGWMSLFVLLGVALLRFDPTPRPIRVVAGAELTPGEERRASPQETPPGLDPRG
jgi:hypothetical protein